MRDNKRNAIKRGQWGWMEIVFFKVQFEFFSCLCLLENQCLICIRKRYCTSIATFNVTLRSKCHLIKILISLQLLKKSICTECLPTSRPSLLSLIVFLAILYQTRIKSQERRIWWSCWPANLLFSQQADTRSALVSQGMCIWKLIWQANAHNVSMLVANRETWARTLKWAVDSSLYVAVGQNHCKLTGVIHIHVLIKLICCSVLEMIYC